MTRRMNSLSLKALVGALACAGLQALQAQPAAPASSGGHEGHHAAPAASPAAAAPELADGEVRRIDKAAGKITIRHGEIKSLSMPPMTMVFVAAQPAMLDQVKVGDRIRFSADQSGGAYRVTAIQPSP